MSITLQQSADKADIIASSSRNHVKRKRRKKGGYSADRLKVLSQFKQTPPGFLEDRRSVYWVDKQPPTGPTKFALTRRQEELVQNKHYHPSFMPDRPSPIWKVSRAAMRAAPTERLSKLAKSKPFHPDWVAMKSVFTRVPRAALLVQPSERLEALAQPKSYAPLPIKSESEWEWGEWAYTIPKAAKTHEASARLEQLSEPKPCSEEYLNNRSVIWPVSRTALHMQATTRLQQLARPKTRQALDQDYDPYRVSFAARMAVPSPRVVDLALPIPRKVRSKKNA